VLKIDDHQLKAAITTSNQELLHNAVLQLCKQLPGASNRLLDLLPASPSAPGFNAIVEEEEWSVVKEKRGKKRKRNLCENCGEDADADDGCCKWARMREAE